jgi:hypothetical protein
LPQVSRGLLHHLLGANHFNGSRVSNITDLFPTYVLHARVV